MGYIENFTALRVWWISRDGETFFKEVSEVNEAILILETLRDYDLYLDNLITDNSGGLEMLDGRGWTEFEDKEGNDIWRLIREEDGEQLDKEEYSDLGKK